MREMIVHRKFDQQLEISRENHFGEFKRYIQISYIYKKIAMNKKQCLATRYQKTKIKPNKINMLV